MSAIPVAEAWLVAGINDRVQLGEAARRLNALIVRGWQLAGVTVQDPATTWIDLRATLAPDVTILPGTQIEGATVVETGAMIGPDTTLVDCEVGEEATVKRTDATLAVIGAGASVGPFAYLRPGTELGADGKIGTFVETKNAQIGAGSKVPHLTYVGDATIGEHSNIGAGTITANYDDVSKHHTEIGSHVHSGSHNVFVAPVRIGDGAKTGAGTVVRKDVPPGALAINVAPQRNMTGWVEANVAGTGEAAAAAEPTRRSKPGPPWQRSRRKQDTWPRSSRPAAKATRNRFGSGSPAAGAGHRRGAGLRSRAHRRAHLRERRDLRALRRERPRLRRLRHPVAHRSDQRVDHGAAHHGRRAQARLGQADHRRRAVLPLRPAGQEGPRPRADLAPASSPTCSRPPAPTAS